MTISSRPAGAAVAVAAVLALGACSSGGSNDSMDKASIDVAGAPEPALGLGNGGRDIPAKGTDGERSDGVAFDPAVLLQSQDLVRAGRVQIVDRDLSQVRDAIDRLLLRYSGRLVNEKTQNDDDGEPVTSSLQVRVPSSRFDAMMSDLQEVGHVEHSTTSTEDVHTQVIDVRSQLTNLRLSLGRLRSFIKDATDIEAMLRYEERITSVESQIATLTAQSNYLEAQTSTSTVDIDMRVPEAVAKKKDTLDDAGFLSGLSAGWHALRNAILVGATVVGALLPFAAVLLLVGVPLWLFLRRRRPAGSVEAPTA